MYWIGLQPGDVHLNISSPGWAKHAWSIVLRAVERRGDGPRRQPGRASTRPALLDAMAARRRRPRSARRRRSGACSSRQDLARLARPAVPARGGRRRRAAEPRGDRPGPRGLGPDHPRRLRPDRDHRCRSATPRASRSSRARWAAPLPGYDVVLLDPVDRARHAPTRARSASPDGPAAPGRPDGRLPRRRRAQRRGACAAATTTPATWPPATTDGYITYVGRTDDVFKASDYRISPFELESVLIEHPAVAEAAVVPSPDPTRLAVPEGLRRAGRRARAGRRDRGATSCATAASTWRRTSGSAGSSSPSCPRPSRARSAGSSCAGARTGRTAPGRTPPPERSDREFWESDFPATTLE